MAGQWGGLRTPQIGRIRANSIRSLDTVPGKPAEHLRAVLAHQGLLPQRDPYLPRFEQWIEAKLKGLPDEVRNPCSTSPPGIICGAFVPRQTSGWPPDR